MNQQINLYQPMFRRQEKVFSAMTMMQTSLLFLIVLSTIYFYGQYRINPLQIELQKFTRDVRSLQSRVDGYRRKLPQPGKSQLLDTEIARLEKELQQRRQIQDILQRQELGNAQGFSAYLKALARQHVQGTWLTRVAIDNGGKSLSLQGKTLSSELVPRYIQRLSEESTLAGLSFNVMELRRPGTTGKQAAPVNGALDFSISTN